MNGNPPASLPPEQVVDRAPVPSGRTPAEITRDARELIRYTTMQIENALVGARVRVTSDHNGQPYGRSRKSWCGQVCTIASVYIEPHDGSMQLCLKEHRYGECFIPANEVEFV